MLAAAAVLLSVCVSGCSREFWKNQADRDSYEVIAEKGTDQRWAVPRIDVEPDPRSRFYDPYDPNDSPLPPDDEAANALMQEVAGKKGYKSWHKFGQAFSVENPQWMDQFQVEPGEEDFVVQSSALGTARHAAAIRDLNLQQLLELSYIHNRDYQSAVEDVYLRALNVTLQRFQFGVRYLGNRGVPGFGATGTSIPDGRNSVGVDSNFGVSQVLPTGAQWLLELTNNTLWVFSGGNSSSASTISWSLTQPLLRGAGRKIVLEDLTQAERDLLYELRDLARFRQVFFGQVVTGSGFGSGYLSLLLQHQTISNRRDNIQRLEQQVEVLQVLSSQLPRRTATSLGMLPEGVVLPPLGAPLDHPAWDNLPAVLRGMVYYDDDEKELVWEGDMTEENSEALRGLSTDGIWRNAVGEIVQVRFSTTIPLEVSQLLSQLTNARNALRASERSLQDSYDAYKISLGLPPDLAFSIDTQLLRQFELIDPELRQLEDEIYAYVVRWSELDPEGQEGLVEDVEEYRTRLLELRQLYDKVIRVAVGQVREDQDKLKSISTERERFLVDEYDRTRYADDLQRDQRLFEDNLRNLNDQNAKIDELLEILDGPAPKFESLYREGRLVRDNLLKYTQSLQVIQVGQRVESVLLQPFEMSLADVMQMALENRLDLMNQKALVMDARRRVEIAANQLEAVMSVTAQGNISTPPGANNPVDFRAANSSYQLGLQFDTPFDQLDERNVYRRAQIEYQRSRRVYMQAEDAVKRDVREAYRQLQVLARNFETSRQAVRLAAIQLDNAIERANDPSVAGGNQNQGLNLLNALQSVLQAQDSFIQTWVQYEQNRINIYRDMGIMEVDERGVWHDDYYRRLTGAPGSEVPQPQHIPSNPPLVPGFDETSEMGTRPVPETARYESGPIPMPPEPLPFEAEMTLPVIQPRQTTAVQTTQTPPRNGRPGGEFSIPVIPQTPAGEDSRNEHRHTDEIAEQSAERRDWKLPVIR
jgi:outer membrane protein TolC